LEVLTQYSTVISALAARLAECGTVKYCPSLVRVSTWLSATEANVAAVAMFATATAEILSRLDLCFRLSFVMDQPLDLDQS
jgi:hypothetical protein